MQETHSEIIDWHITIHLVLEKQTQRSAAEGDRKKRKNNSWLIMEVAVGAHYGNLCATLVPTEEPTEEQTACLCAIGPLFTASHILDVQGVFQSPSVEDEKIVIAYMAKR